METPTLYEADVQVLMTEAEARECVDAIKSGIINVGRKLLELHEREGWRALGYASWRECAQAEFGFRQSRVYQLLEAAEIERNISTMVEIPIPERQLRPLAALPADLQREVWQQAVDTAPNGKVTAAHVQIVVNEYTRPPEHVTIVDEWGHEETVTVYPGEELRVVSKPHVANNSGNNEWYTPAEYIEAARRVLGGIDLDPASSAQANEVVQAAEYFTAEVDGLAQEWHGRVWMNPPYAKVLVEQFADKMAYHAGNGDVPEAIVLVNNATETAWFRRLIGVAAAVVFPASRVRFWQPNSETGAPLQGQAVIYIGSMPNVFLSEFAAFGWGATL